MSYLKSKLAMDKWYVSEGFVAVRLPASDDDIDRMVRHNIGAHKMILAGPFETKILAETAAQQFQTEFEPPYVWRNSTNTRPNAE